MKLFLSFMMSHSYFPVGRRLNGFSLVLEHMCDAMYTITYNHVITQKHVVPIISKVYKILVSTQHGVMEWNL